MPKPNFTYKTLFQIFSQPNVPYHEFLLTVKAPEQEGKPREELQFHVLVAEDGSIGTTDPEQATRLDDFYEESRPMMINAHFVLESEPEVVRMATWATSKDGKLQGWSAELQERVDAAGETPVFGHGTHVSVDAWPLKERKN